jgi:hypothetical protein
MTAILQMLILKKLANILTAEGVMEVLSLLLQQAHGIAHQNIYRL